MGYSGRGVFNQSGGTHVVGEIFILGNAAGPSGIYNLSNDEFFSNPDEFVGSNGVGTFNQSGGLHVTEYLTIGYGATGMGTMNLSGGQLMVHRDVFVGNGTGGRDTLNVTGGSMVSGDLIVTTLATAKISGGTVSVKQLYMDD